MPKADDPFYNRKPVPDEFIQDVAPSGLTPQEEFYNRERKYSDQNGVDVRKFGNKKNSGFKPESDPYYGRRRVSNAEIHGVAESGLTADEEFLNRERKFSVNGVDVRRFSNSASGGFKPQNDPYYGRKPIDKSLTKGIGETGYTPAEEFETRERKQSVVNFSSDPFQLLTGQGHRQSISMGAGIGAEATRRRSSAAAPDAPGRQGSGAGHTHSGYVPDTSLQPIESRTEGVTGVTGNAANGTTNATQSGQISDHDASTSLSPVTKQPAITSEYHDPDAVGPRGER